MNKSWKKAFVLVLCVALCVVSTFSCFAQLIQLGPTDSDLGGITVTLDATKNEITANMSATAFRIIKVNVEDSADNTQHQPKEPVYYWAKGVAEWIAAHDTYKKYIDTANENAVTAEYTKFVQDENVYSTDPEYVGFIDALTAAIRNNLIQFNKDGVGVAGINFVIKNGQYVMGGKDPDNEEERIPLVQTRQFTDNNPTTTITGLSKGSYIVLVEGSSRIYQSAVANLTPVYYATNPGTADSGFVNPGWYVSSPAELNIKAADVSLTKKVSDVSATAEGADAVTAGMDDTVYFTITAGVPKYLDNAISKTFSITDRVPKGLTMTNGSVKVYGVNAEGAETLLTAGTDYTYSSLTLTTEEQAAYSSGFTVDFDGKYDRISTYKEIKIVYDATVDTDAVLGKDGNRSPAQMTYANNPYTTEAGKTISDDAVVYTYGFKLIKTGEQETIKLPGAVFTVDKKTGDTWSPVYFTAGNNGVYERTLTGNQNKVQTGDKVGENESMLGILMLKGLDVGTYRITEVQAPAGGYLLLKAPIEFYIVDEMTLKGEDYVNGPDGIPDTVNAQGVGQKTNQTGDDAQKGYIVRSVRNSTGFDLPLTGGMGTVLFTVGGAALIVGAVVLLLIANRKKSRCN